MKSMDNSCGDSAGSSCRCHSSVITWWMPKHETNSVGVFLHNAINKDEVCSKSCLLIVAKCRVSLAGAAAGVAICGPVLGEAAGGNHHSDHPGLKHPPPNTCLHKSGHGRQGAAPEILCCHLLSVPMSSLSLSPGCILPNPIMFCLLQAMKVVGIKAHTENDKGQVLLDLYIRWSFICQLFGSGNHLRIVAFEKALWQFFFPFFSYVGNVEINVEVKRYFCKAGVKGIQVCWAESGLLKASSPQFSPTCRPLPCLQLHGMMRVILEPLIGDVPIVGAVTMFFIKRPVCPSNSHLCPSLHSHRYYTSQYSRLCLLCYWFLWHPDHFASLFPETGHQLDRHD